MCVKPTSRTFLFVSPRDIFLGGGGTKKKNNKRLHFNTTSSLHHFVVILFMTNLLRRKKPLSEQLRHQYLFSFKGKYIARQSAGEQLHQRKKQNALRVQRVIHNRSYNPQIRGLHNLLIWSEGEAHLLPLRAVHARDSSRVSLTVCSKHLQVRGVHICILDGGLQLSLPGIKGERKKKKSGSSFFSVQKKSTRSVFVQPLNLYLYWFGHLTLMPDEFVSLSGKHGHSMKSPNLLMCLPLSLLTVKPFLKLVYWGILNKTL